MTRGRGQRRDGFTLIEVMVSIAILMTLAVILIPQWARYNTKQMSNQLAQQMAAQLRELSVRSVRTESYMFLDIVDATHYQIYNQGTTPSGNITFEATSSAPIDISQEYGRASFIVTGAGVGGVLARIAFGPKGWAVDPDDAGYPTNVYSTVTGITDPSETPAVKYYPITIDCGLTDGTYVVRVYRNGKVTVNT